MARRAAMVALNQERMNLDEERTQLNPVVDKFQELSDHQGSPSEVRTFDEPGDVPCGIFKEEESNDEEGELTWMDMIGVAIRQIHSEDDDTDDIYAATIPLFRREEAKIKDLTHDNSTWYPFLNKEYLLGSLLVGYLHKLISRNLYHQIRSILTMYYITIPQ
ncbi:uncharacterized protein PGTG_13168 [Puccinia graminis f. sp. tritici CRL 75-36-700-3]|uniref:Uncharacterized protein n=1 Tax=Puccinia graminis f. sp. tritici (strain CRL 75-36-700-3 / race SCCL) TaxID=418459 RepID=E3KR61_PUCGT|nr:uncharacterized protein PGTG_13168 [Puccinia graminis f. sp. tritici CRL 75-36-700-3]EFP86786.2 hypothetical protein PGTG_13168 [Puccinia graminis f. sp. tritici CRL 75-36-700-3]